MPCGRLFPSGESRQKTGQRRNDGSIVTDIPVLFMLYDRSTPSESNGFQAQSASFILSTHLRLLGHALLSDLNGNDAGNILYNAPTIVLAHDNAADPVFFYANRAAQQLFEMSWAEMVNLPSRLSAEPIAQHERQRLLDQVSTQGYIDDYSGVRISKTGKRFTIRNATVWNLIDHHGQIAGQAAAFNQWTLLA